MDDNVTRHVGPELSGNDWDVLVLHYLGLDHIGHLAGPYSPLVGPKLQEMDHVIKTIHETLSEQVCLNWCRYFINITPFLFLLIGEIVWPYFCEVMIN